MQHLATRLGPRGRLLQGRQFGILPGNALAQAMLVQFCPKGMALGGALQFGIRTFEGWRIETGQLSGGFGARVSRRSKARNRMIADESRRFDQA